MKYAIPLSLAALLGTVAAIGDEVDPQTGRKVQVQAGREGVQVDVNRNAPRTDTQKLEQDPQAIRISELMGVAVRNHQNEELGNIEDLVIDLNTGKVRYAAISMGGFLGIGDKLFAVPFEAITFRQQRVEGVVTDAIQHVAVVNVNKENLANAQGFDQDKWPNMADRRWQELNDRPYRTGARTQPDDDRTIER